MTTGKEFAFTDKDFRFLSELVYDKTGIVLAEHKRNMVYSRLTRRLRTLGIHTFEDYIALLKHPDIHTDEIGNLVNAITTNLTSFFREAHHFDHLRDTLSEKMASRVPDAQKRVRIWSAGCSSGAEPYSIAMVVRSLMGVHSGWDIKILATDIDTNMLDLGIQGVYKLEELENIPTQYRKYCHKTSDTDGLSMNDELKKLIFFRRLNLLDAVWPVKGPFDIVFCRNVVIYFDKPTQQTLFARYASLMKNRSFLYIGHSENLFKVSTDFKLIGKTIYQKHVHD